MIPDADTCYRAVAGRDPRFDGWFFTAVTSTGIYCRPSCPARTPGRDRVRFFPSAASAQRHGFRACKRCRPDACPGSPDWNIRADVAGRALRLIGDGVVDRDGVAGLSSRLGYSTRQLHRTLLAEVGAGPLALARSRRAQTARVLLETTDLPVTEVAFAAGFASVRQFNDTIREVFCTNPSGLRAGRTPGASGPAGVIELRLPFRPPMDVAFTLRWLGWHTVAGLESFADTDTDTDTGAGAGAGTGAGAGADGGDRAMGTPTGYRRTLDLPHAPGRVRLSVGGPTWVAASLTLGDQRDLGAAVARIRRLLDLDADPLSIDSDLAVDPRLRPLVLARPGLRSPGDVSGFETMIRTVIGQQISLTGARTVIGRVVDQFGGRLPGTPGADTGPDRLFPGPDTLAAANPEELPMPRARGRAVVAVAQAFVAGRISLHPGVDRAATRAALLQLPGVGPWTADYVAMRSLSDPDVLLATDLATRRIADRMGLDLTVAGHEWSPWRSYVTHHLWAVALTDRPAPTPKSTNRTRLHPPGSDPEESRLS